VHQGVKGRRVSAYGNRNLTGTMDVHHIELTGLEDDLISGIDGAQLDRERIIRFTDNTPDGEQ
jgi:hypothetical protein